MTHNVPAILGGGTYNANGTSTFYIPEFGFNRMLSKDAAGNDRSFGVAAYGAGGQNTDYAMHPILGGASYINLEQLFIQPTFSSKVGENHSFGISAIFAFQRFEARGLGGFDNPFVSASPGNVTDNGKSNSHGIGLSLGWIGKISDRFSLGAMYQTKISMSAFDKYKGLIPEGGLLDIPAKAGIGLAFKASDKVDVLFDITHVFYSDTQALGAPTIAVPNPFNPPLGASTGFGWDDQTVYRLGLVYKHSPKLTLRAGLNYGENPAPNSTFNDTFFNSLTPVISEKHVSLGFTYQINPKMSITGSYVRAFDKTLDGNGVKLTPPGIGTPAPDIRVDSDAFGLSFNWKY